jgi:hypothetical protein
LCARKNQKNFIQELFELLSILHKSPSIFPRPSRSCLVDAQLLIASTTFPLFPATLITLLCVLQVLHIIWSILIANIVLAALRPGGHTQDARSDSEESDAEPDTPAEIDRHRDD